MNLRCVLLARIAIVFALFVPVAWSQAIETDSGTAFATIRDCAERSDNESRGLDELEGDCPGLGAALDAIGASEWLSQTQRDELTTQSLADLVTLTERYRAASSDAQLLDPARLEPILATLDEQKQGRPPGLLDRFKHWLRTLLERQSEGGSWLTRWLSEIDLPRNATLIILWILAVLVVIAAVGVIVNELRAAGVLGNKSPRRHSGAAAALAAASSTGPLTLADIDAAPLNERPSLLLRLLVTSLASAGRLRAERSLTHRELIARASFDDASQRESFAGVASLAERIVYGSAQVAAAEIHDVLDAGRALQVQLGGAT